MILVNNASSVRRSRVSRTRASAKTAVNKAHEATTTNINTKPPEGCEKETPAAARESLGSDLAARPLSGGAFREHVGNGPRAGAHFLEHIDQSRRLTGSQLLQRTAVAVFCHQHQSLAAQTPDLAS